MPDTRDVVGSKTDVVSASWSLQFGQEMDRNKTISNRCLIITLQQGYERKKHDAMREHILRDLT